MEQADLWLLAAAALLVVLGLLLRQRYGNLYERSAAAFERWTGWRMTSVLAILAVATLAGWAAVYLLFGDDQETGLDSLFPGIFQGQPEPGTD